MSSWDRFSREKQVFLARRFAIQCYARERVYLGSRLLVDKELFPPEDRESFISSVEVLFPTAQILAMVRNPEAVVNSMRQREWGYSVDGMEPRPRSVEECIKIWNHGAIFAARLSSRENTTVVKFGNLVSEPEKESTRIAEVLHLSQVKDFTPLSTLEVTLSADECDRIWSSTKEARRLLEEHGIAWRQHSYSARL